MEEIDSQKMYKIYEEWPNLSKKYFEKNFEKIRVSNINHIIFAGMGGSGALGDIFSSILSKTNIQVSVVKGFHLPSTINNKSLVITTSVSGNTKETLRVLDLANKQESKIISFSSGGKMEQFCNNNQIIFRKISLFHSPRTSLINFTYSILKILNSILNIYS